MQQSIFQTVRFTPQGSSRVEYEGADYYFAKELMHQFLEPSIVVEMDGRIAAGNSAWQQL